ncbi:MAG: hypothetical protein AAF902_02605 [Chloroflexota bacterium]
MRYYVFLKKFVPFIVILYFIVGNFTWGVYRLEIFPVFSWELFSLVPNLEVDYGLKVNAINNEALETPAYFQDLSNDFSEAKSITAFFVIQDLGEAIEADDNESVQKLRHQIETTYLSEKNQVEYIIVKRSYYPIKRWRTGAFEMEAEIERYAN